MLLLDSTMQPEIELESPFVALDSITNFQTKDGVPKRMENREGGEKLQNKEEKKK